MSRVLLFWKRHQSHQVGSHLLHLDQIYVTLKIDGEPVVIPCVMDSGAPMTAFREDDWRRIQSRITWLAPKRDATLPKWLRHFSGAAGGSVPFRLGSVAILVPSMEGPSIRLGPRSVVAWFAFDRGKLRDSLFGLSGLAGLRLELDHDAQEAWLVSP